jgi:hypothetical protein
MIPTNAIERKTIINRIKANKAKSQRSDYFGLCLYCGQFEILIREFDHMCINCLNPNDKLDTRN